MLKIVCINTFTENVIQFLSTWCITLILAHSISTKQLSSTPLQPINTLSFMTFLHRQRKIKKKKKMHK